MISSTAEVIANIAGLVTGTEAVVKVAEKVKEIAEAVEASADLAEQINNLVSEILKTAAANNQTMTQDQANTAAQNQLAQIAVYQESQGGSTDDWKSALSLAAEIDPTGILAAANAFAFGNCKDVTA